MITEVLLLALTLLLFVILFVILWLFQHVIKMPDSENVLFDDEGCNKQRKLLGDDKTKDMKKQKDMIKPFTKLLIKHMLNTSSMN